MLSETITKIIPIILFINLEYFLIKIFDKYVVKKYETIQNHNIVINDIQNP